MIARLLFYMTFTSVPMSNLMQLSSPLRIILRLLPMSKMRFEYCRTAMQYNGPSLIP